MAMKPLRPCAHPGCLTLTRGRWCDAHTPRYTRGESEAWHWMYGLPEWKSGRDWHLLHNPWCVECSKEGKRVRATVVDHIVPHRGDKTLFLDPKNWQSMCKRHHDAKTMAERRQREGHAGARTPPPTPSRR